MIFQKYVFVHKKRTFVFGNSFSRLTFDKLVRDNDLFATKSDPDTCWYNSNGPKTGLRRVIQELSLTTQIFFARENWLKEPFCPQPFWLQRSEEQQSKHRWCG